MVSGKEADSHRQSPIFLQRETGGPQQKVARYLGHDANAIAALAIGGHGATMRKAPQRGQGVGQYLVRGLIRDSRNEADTA
jgi:hypothetical protein